MTAAAKAGNLLDSPIAALKRCAIQKPTAAAKAAVNTDAVSARLKPCPPTAPHTANRLLHISSCLLCISNGIPSFDARVVLARLAVVWACVLALASPLAARSWRIADYGDTITVGRDGSASVQERITLVFDGTFEGIHRIIPVQYPGPRDTNYTLFLKVTGVTDGAGNRLKYESKSSGNYRDLKIYIPGAADTTRTVEIAYTVRNAVRYFEDHDEFYWNVTGNDWPVPIDHVSAMVGFPSAAD
jgi:hypothetical protein